MAECRRCAVFKGRPRPGAFIFVSLTVTLVGGLFCVSDLVVDA